MIPWRLGNLCRRIATTGIQTAPSAKHRTQTDNNFRVVFDQWLNQERLSSFPCPRSSVMLALLEELLRGPQRCSRRRDGTDKSVEE
jgi:hypothetical protein